MNVDDDFINELNNLTDEEDSNSSKCVEYNNKEYIKTSNVLNSEVLNSFVDIINNSLKESSDTVLISLKNIEKGNSNTNNNVYFLINKCHGYLSTINEEIHTITKQIEELYSKRFRDLRALIPISIDYVKTVHKLGNNIVKNINTLNDILPAHLIISISMMSTSSKGKDLSNKELTILNNKCNEAIKLNEIEHILYSFIQTKLKIIAPNLSALIGPNIAAKLLIAAGGIKNLAVMPASNILVLGNKAISDSKVFDNKKTNKGFLKDAELIKNQPENMQVKALRKLSNKCALAARSDMFGSNYSKIYCNFLNDNVIDNNNNNYNINIDNDNDNDNKYNDENENEYGLNYFDDNVENKNTLLNNKNTATNNSLNTDINKEEYGASLKQQIESKLEKIKESKQPSYLKPLPRPDDKPKPRRGGARKRKLIEKYKQTEARKNLNRLKFGEEAEVEHDYSGKGFGMLEYSNVLKHKSKKLNNNNNNSNSNMLNNRKQMLKKINNDYDINKNVVGIASTLELNSDKGLSLINPELLKNKRTIYNTSSIDTSGYFSTNKGFTSVLNKSLVNQK